MQLSLSFHSEILSFSIKSNNTDLEECLKIIVEPSHKGTAIFGSSIFVHFNHRYRSGSSSITFLDDSSMHPFGLLFPWSDRGPSPFLRNFNEKIRFMISSGLINYWFENIQTPKGFMPKSEDIGPQVLTMESLSICFLICLAALGIASIVFVLECFVFYLQVFARNVVLKFVSLTSVCAFLRSQGWKY